jgi:hypothetical protein
MLILSKYLKCTKHRFKIDSRETAIIGLQKAFTCKNTCHYDENIYSYMSRINIGLVLFT